MAGAALVYTWIGYSFLLALGRSRRRMAPLPSAAAGTPLATVIVAAYNEEACIAEKISNLLAQDDQTEVIVVSDGSTDATHAIVERFLSRRVRLLVQDRRMGKNLALNRGVEEASGEVLVFTDANAMLAPGALSRLLAAFADPSIGLVSGQGLYGDVGPGATRLVSSAYTRYEALIREGESRFGFLAGVDGALYALRRSLYHPLEGNQVHDLLHPIQVALAGKSCAFVPEAFTVEPPSSGSGSEFRRQVRIIAQGFLVFGAQAPRLLAQGRLKELGMLVSHRLLRWTSAFFLAAAFVSNLYLADVHPAYRVSMITQILFYLMAIVGALAGHFDLRLRIAALPFYFCLVSLAGLSGLIESLRGRRYTVWSPGGRGTS
jgi:cellulose synthase/poly-beta-1,6-N-acetylglucosamine synthase-like glycosyltransferase